jgi:hypothetical protein
MNPHIAATKALIQPGQIFGAPVLRKAMFLRAIPIGIGILEVTPQQRQSAMCHVEAVMKNSLTKKPCAANWQHR